MGSTITVWRVVSRVFCSRHSFLLTSYFYSINWGIPKFGFLNLIWPKGLEVCDGRGGAGSGNRNDRNAQESLGLHERGFAPLEEKLLMRIPGSGQA